MISFFYNCIILLFTLALFPKILWQYFRHGKYKGNLASRLGLNLPKIENKNKPVIWMHAVSVGETRALIPLYQKMRQEHGHAMIVISSITETGYREAKRSLAGADAYFFLPLDFSWNMKRLIRKIQPNILILSEGDVWYHLLKYAKKWGTKSILVSGKISERSASLFSKIRFFSRRLYLHIDQFCLQNENYSHRFLALGVDPSKIQITGNLKLDIASQQMSAEEKQYEKKQYGISDENFVILVASTHHDEEKKILAALEPVWNQYPHVKIFIAPRHPERFAEVALLFQSKGYSFISHSQRSNRIGNERLILLDSMGLLQKCYQLSKLAIVGGSFVPHVGGHNIFEPIQFGIPVLFGPHMHGQRELVELVTSAQAGRSITMDELAQEINTLILRPEHLEEKAQLARQLSLDAQGSTDKTWKSLKPLVDQSS